MKTGAAEETKAGGQRRGAACVWQMGARAPRQEEGLS